MTITLSRASFDRFHVARDDFSVRFGYVRWLFHLLTGEAPGFAEIGKAIGVTGQAVSGWAKRESAPASYASNKALVAYFGASEAWLIEGQGGPPRPDLWDVWLAARTRKGGALPPAITDLEHVAKTGQQRRTK
jgi:transcriptional regulator with XRE-family HTH domain